MIKKPIEHYKCLMALMCVGPSSRSVLVISQVSMVCQQLKDHMFIVYEENSQAMEARLLELSQVLENCSQLLADLQGVSQDLAALNTGLCQAED